MRATTEQINGVWQGACYPFREGLATGIMNVEFSPKGQLIAGGFTTSRQWPVRGTEPFAIQRIDWNGVVPFEIKEINIKKDGFLITFTKPVDKQVAARTDAYNITTYTHIYHAGYGSPEVDQTTPRVTRAVPSADGLSVMVASGENHGGPHPRFRSREDYLPRRPASSPQQGLLHGERNSEELGRHPKPQP